ncbi:hypothetical protein BH23GEM4_BH23GEM4_21330 [soil metagenome]
MLATGTQRPRFVGAADHTAVMRRILFPLLVALMGLPAHAFAQGGASGQEAVIQNALSAAPPAVAEKATVADFQGHVVREGSNGWTCMPDMPDVPNNSPMCLDKPWLEVIDAWMNKRDPSYTGVAISYMLQGDMPVSNTDPFATGPASGNEWIQEGVPHIMVAVSDHALLQGLPTDPNNGGPWVMWKGTPYAHIMIPTVPRTQ